MALPLANTTISVYSRAADTDQTPYTPAVPLTLKASGIAAVITVSGGSERSADTGEQTTRRHVLHCDITDLAHTDVVKDETTNQVYEVEWVSREQGLGLDFLRGGLVRSVGTEYSSV